MHLTTTPKKTTKAKQNYNKKEKSKKQKYEKKIRKNNLALEIYPETKTI